MQPNIVANVPRHQGMLLGGIVANQQNCWSCEDVRHARSRIGLPPKRRRQSREIRGAVVIHVVRLQTNSSELGKKVRMFVGSAIRSDYPNRRPAIAIANLRKLPSDQLKRFFPRRRSELAVLPDQRTRQPLFMIREIKSVTSLDAEEIAIRPALVAVIPAHNLHSSVSAGITATRAGRMAISSASRDVKIG